MYIDKLDDIVKKYNSTYHKLTLVKKLMMNILNLKLGILLELQNVKTFLQKAIFQIGLKTFLLLQKLKILFRGHMLLVILKVKNLLERFTKQSFKKQIKKSLELQK